MNTKCCLVDGYFEYYQVLVIGDEVKVYYFDTYDEAKEKVDEVKKTGRFMTIHLNMIRKVEEVINFGKGGE